MQHLTGLLQPMDTVLHCGLKCGVKAGHGAGRGLYTRAPEMHARADVFLDLIDIMSISQCGTSSWKAVGGLVAAVSKRKGSLAIGFGAGGVYWLQEWDDRPFANNRACVRTDLNQ